MFYTQSTSAVTSGWNKIHASVQNVQHNLLAHNHLLLAAQKPGNLPHPKQHDPESWLHQGETKYRRQCRTFNTTYSHTITYSLQHRSLATSPTPNNMILKAGYIRVKQNTGVSAECSTQPTRTQSLTPCSTGAWQPPPPQTTWSWKLVTSGWNKIQASVQNVQHNLLAHNHLLLAAQEPGNLPHPKQHDPESWLHQGETKYRRQCRTFNTTYSHTITYSLQHRSLATSPTPNNMILKAGYIRVKQNAGVSAERSTQPTRTQSLTPCSTGAWQPPPPQTTWSWKLVTSGWNKMQASVQNVQHNLLAHNHLLLAAQEPGNLPHPKQHDPESWLHQGETKYRRQCRTFNTTYSHTITYSLQHRSLATSPTPNNMILKDAHIVRAKWQRRRSNLRRSRCSILRVRYSVRMGK